MLLILHSAFLPAQLDLIYSSLLEIGLVKDVAGEATSSGPRGVINEYYRLAVDIDIAFCEFPFESRTLIICLRMPLTFFFFFEAGST